MVMHKMQWSKESPTLPPSLQVYIVIYQVNRSPLVHTKMLQCTYVAEYITAASEYTRCKDRLGWSDPDIMTN